ncbi:hypothetical protein [Dyella sp.]|uniref:hypothetical protein n=1 Tax=Dyella sp. TaxID=1869338 RepID=UPI002FDB3A7F
MPQLAGNQTCGLMAMRDPEHSVIPAKAEIHSKRREMRPVRRKRAARFAFEMDAFWSNLQAAHAATDVHNP